MTNETNALRCPCCGCAEFIESETGTTKAYAHFLFRDDYPVLDERLDGDTDVIWFECSECGLEFDTDRLVEAAK